VGEPDPAVGSLQDARGFGPPHAGRCPVGAGRRRDDQVLGRTGRRRHDEEPGSGARRERGKPGPQQLLQVLRDRQGLARRWPDILPGEGADDLQGEERVAFRDPV
jgi:hypothetical protein